jgi:metallophosphoesterase (TIGR00282 family)
MNLLFIGDIVGESGREAVCGLCRMLCERHGISYVIANGENIAGGNGLTLQTARELLAGGVDVVTSGDHVWDQKDFVADIVREPRVLRPANYPAGTPGEGWIVWKREGLPPIAVLNLQGRVFMPALENPFTVADATVQRLRKQTPIILVDIHAEATSEKIAMGRFLDGRVSAVIGTHTHVQTADEQIFPGGTAFLSDAGFTGPQESILGREIEPVIRRFVTQMPQRFKVATQRVVLHGAVIEVDDATGHARNIRRLQEPH